LSDISKAFNVLEKFFSKLQNCLKVSILYSKFCGFRLLLALIRQCFASTKVSLKAFCKLKSSFMSFEAVNRTSKALLKLQSFSKA
jgi:hypothetical protein